MLFQSTQKGRCNETYRFRTQEVTCWPLSRHFSGLGSFFLQLMKAKFSSQHLVEMCLEEAMSTEEVGMGPATASTPDAIATGPTHRPKNEFRIEEHKIWR